MNDYTPGDPSPAYTYRGFTAPEAPSPPRSTPAWRRPKTMVITLSACAMGLILGVWAKPQLGVGGPAPEPMKPVSARPLDGAMQILVDAAPAEPSTPAAKSAPLEVLPADMVAAAARTSAIESPPQARRISVPEPDTEPLVTPPPPRMAEARPPRGPVRASFDCRAARTPAEEMVCQDPSLAAADRRLARAFRRAADAGVPYDHLRGEQDDWMSIREAAARRSPDAVASIYDQRTEELEAMAEGDWEY